MEDKKDFGEIKISTDVISVIVSNIVDKIDGVTGFGANFANNIFAKKGSTKGIKVEFSNEELVIDISVIVKYGIKIPEIAWQIQEQVKDAVETMTGLKVKEINIHVQGVSFDQDNVVSNEKTIDE